MLSRSLEIASIPHDIKCSNLLETKYGLFSGENAESNWVLMQNLEISSGWKFFYN